LAALGIAVLALLWVTAALSSGLFGSGWTTVSLGKLTVVPLNLASHLSEPRLAWPPPARTAMPGAAGVYLSAALSVGVAAIIGVGLARTLRDRTDLRAVLGAKPAAKPRTARWASRRDIRTLVVAQPQQGRLTLGRAFGKVIAAEARQSVIVFGPTGSYKTAGLAIPVLREWDGPVIATSVKTDLLLRTYSHRRARGKVHVFDPTRITDKHRCQATPLTGCEDWRGALKVANWLTRATKTSGAGLENAEFWYGNAERLLAPLLFAAANSDRRIADVLRWLEEGKEALGEVNEVLAQAEEPAAQRALGASWRREERQRSAVHTTAETVLAAYNDPFVAKETSRATYAPSESLDGRSDTLYLCAPETEQERLRPLFSAVVLQLLDAAYSKASSTGPLSPPLLVLLDEAANVAPIPNLAGLASSGAGQGIQLLSVFQDFAQVRDQYGDVANSIVNNHTARLFTPGIGDPETMNYVASLTGHAEFTEHSRTAGEAGQRSTTEGTAYHALASPSEVREGAEASALLAYRQIPLIRIGLRLPKIEDA